MDQEKLKQIDTAWKKYLQTSKAIDEKEWEAYLKTIQSLDEQEMTFVRERLSHFFN